MRDSDGWYGMSRNMLGAALLTLVLVPVGCAVTGWDNSGLERLSDDITLLFFCAVLIGVLLLISLVSGMRAIRQHRIAAFWVVPLAILFAGTAGYGIFGLYIYVFDPYGLPG